MTAPIQAQITLTEDDIPEFGTVLVYAQDTSVVNADLGSVSASGQSWTFLDFNVHIPVSNTVVPPDETPAADLFPDATFAFESDNGLYSYLRAAADALYIAGGSAPGPTGDVFTVALEPQQQLLAVPATYGTTFDSEFGFRLTIDGSVLGLPDSVRIIQRGEVSAEVDAFGEMTLPAGIFEVLRQRVQTVTTDSVQIRLFGNYLTVEVTVDTTVTYDWWAKDGVGRICTIEVDEAGNPLSATYLTAINPTVMLPDAIIGAEFVTDRQVQFLDESLNGPTAWQWDFGDGNSSEEQNPLHTYGVEGSYEVCLIASNSAGSSPQVCIPIEVIFIPIPEAAFAAEPLQVGEVQFTDLSANDPTEWAWDFGDGNSSEEQNPLHTYEAEGSYEVCLTVSNLAGASEICQTLNIVIVNSKEAASPPQSLSAHPSPAREWLEVDLNGLRGQGVNLRCFNLQGQLMAQYDWGSAPSHLRIQVSDWPAGLYYLTATGQQGKRHTLAFTVQ